MASDHTILNFLPLKKILFYNTDLLMSIIFALSIISVFTLFLHIFVNLHNGIITELYTANIKHLYKLN